MDIPVITLDGPGGVGKGTVGVWLAQRLGWHFLDSGAIYRVLALAALESGVALDDGVALAELGKNLDLQFRLAADGGAGVILQGRDVSESLRAEDCGSAASKIATLPLARAALLSRQRAFRQAPGLVADGRDMGTVMFADAPIKFFLDASPEARAERRYKQLKKKGLHVKLAELIREMAERDARDRNRATAPLQAAADAVIIDTSELEIAAVQSQIWEHLQKSPIGNLRGAGINPAS